MVYTATIALSFKKKGQKASECFILKADGIKWSWYYWSWIKLSIDDDLLFSLYPQFFLLYVNFSFFSTMAVMLLIHAK